MDINTYMPFIACSPMDPAYGKQTMHCEDLRKHLGPQKSEENNAAHN